MVSLGAEVECDAQGRVVLPEDIMNRANLGREITLVGVQDHLELFTRSRWAEFREKLYASSNVLEAWAREKLQNPAPVQDIPKPPQTTA